jgi:hypothetical protein
MTYQFAFIIRTMCCVSYEFIRSILPLPNLNILDETFKGNVNEIDAAMSDMGQLHLMLQHYMEVYVPPGSLKGWRRDDQGNFENADVPIGKIPAVIAVDAMAVEPYSAANAKQRNNGNIRVEAANGAKTGTCSYLFVYYLQPLDPELPSIVISVVPRADGKAGKDTIDHLSNLARICSESGCWVMAVSGDGDNEYDHIMATVLNFVHDNPNMTFMDFVQNVGSLPNPFVTDFLHFAKCLRNKLAKHPLSLDRQLRQFTGMEIAQQLNLGDSLNPKSPGSQLKDAIAMRVFTIENLTLLLQHEEINAALYFLPIVCWRVVNQAINMRRDDRLTLLNVAFDLVRSCLSHLQDSGMKQQGAVGEPLYLFRKVDLQKMMSSFVVIGFILQLPMEKINLGRIGTSGLEHLFGVTRLATRGNNHADSLRRQMAKSIMVKWIAEKNWLELGDTRKRNLGGTIDDAQVENPMVLPEVSVELAGRRPTIGMVLYHAALTFNNTIRRDWCMSALGIFRQVRYGIVDRQRISIPTVLGGLHPFPRMAVVQQVKQEE